MNLLTASIAMIAISGLPGALLSRQGKAGQGLAALLSAAGTFGGLFALQRWYSEGAEAVDVRHAWSLAPDVDFHVGLDGLSAVFLLPIFLISLAGSIYGLGYWRQSEHPDNGRKLRLFYGLCAAGMALVVVARNSVVFLLGWETMAASAFFLVATEDDRPPVAEAGWLYLASTHAATLTLFGLFGVLWAFTGSFDLPAPGSISPVAANAVFFLALLGFGFKAGIMPLHFWLPSAHANAPSHVSALMSGVLIKMGVYGIVRTLSFLPQPPLWWGGLLIALGVISGVIGLAFAIGQSDFKRLLAYSSIENIGIICIGIGLALLGRSVDRSEWVVLGMGGALWHVWNHALFKALLFFGAGSVLHAVETREINELGGLAKRMPWTAFCFLGGAAAVCGLPPLNGFVSEFAIYTGLFSTLGIPENSGTALPGASLAAPGLALIGALAVACYATAYGGIFLGAPRSSRVDHAHESPAAMLAPMLLLLAGCLFVGLAPGIVAPALDPGVSAWAGGAELTGELTPLAEQLPLGWLSALGLGLAGTLTAGGLALWSRLRPGFVESSVTWGCGYAAPSARMQYTSNSFSEILVGLFRWALLPRTERPSITELFPRTAQFQQQVQDSVLESIVMPGMRWLASRLLLLRVLQQGNIRIYLFYVFAALLLLLVWP